MPEKKHKTLKNGLLCVYNGFERTVLKPLSALVGVSDRQTLTNKTIDGNKNTLLNVPETTIPILITEEAEDAFLVYSDGVGLTQIQLN